MGIPQAGGLNRSIGAGDFKLGPEYLHVNNMRHSYGVFLHG